MYQLILASGSPRRKEILEQCGIAFQVQKSDAEEIITETAPCKVVSQLSCLKAKDVADKVTEENSIVIGADTIVVNGGQILGKPKDKQDAFEMINSLQGHAHSVFTGVTILVKEKENQKVITFAVETKVMIVPMTEEEIRDYIATEEPMDKAGAYAIQGRFACYVKGIEGDYYNVVGLPISKMTEEMKKIEINLKKDCKK